MRIFLLPFILFSINSADVEKAVLEHLYGHFPLQNADYVCDFSRLDISRIPEADSVEINGYGKERPKGQVVVFFSFFNKGERVYRTNGTVRVGILKEVLTASVPIKMGEPFTDENTGYEIRDIASSNDEPVELKDNISGKVASRFIPAGKIITLSSLKTPPVVSPGDVVEILYDERAFSLKVGGVVKQEGARGDRVRVMNIDTRKVVYATVVDSATVAIKHKEGI
ncbi:MAG: flagellar basal body P-ring formation protein FlgA [Candidatus Zixiibacteriota bacterium]|nr:MAG: flagellar basal body P-ring formation protein FlgA [candidate division Zixibacteria bacterium]